MPRTSNAMRRFSRTLALLTVLGLAQLALPATSAASPKPLARAVSNILFGPLDVLTSPIVAGKGIVTNLQDIDDTTAVRVAYTVPGFLWWTGVTIGAGVIRTATGILELVPGIFLVPFETDLKPLMPPVEDGASLFEYENDYFPVKFGIDYTSAE